MLLRNRELRIQLLLSCAAVAVAALVVRAAVGRVAAQAVLAAGAVVVAVTMGFTLWRYHRLARLAQRVDAVLAGQRDVSLDDMGEGELAVLASQLSKTVSRLHVANDELGRERQALADSLADISHQLRTPLTSLGLELALMRRDLGGTGVLAALPVGVKGTGVKGTGALTPAASVLAEEGGGDEEGDQGAKVPVPLTPASQDALATQRARVRDAERLLGRVQWLVESLLKLARLDAGVITLTSERVDVERLAADAFAPLAVSFDLAGVACECEVAEGTSYVGDASWTREALTNILKNCLEHTPEGGTVRLMAWEDALACRIRVRDTGPGIAEEDLPHVFERFYRGSAADADDATNPTGVGIGLSLAQALVAAQGGALIASNETDEQGAVRGARFDISFYKLVV